MYRRTLCEANQATCPSANAGDRIASRVRGAADGTARRARHAREALLRLASVF